VAGDRFPLTVKFQTGRAHNFEMIVGNLNGDKKTASSLGATSHEHKHH
jgi:copper(I)-binding protein